MAENAYRVEFAPRARRDLRALPEAVAAACVELIVEALASEPRRVGKPLVSVESLIERHELVVRSART